MFGINGIEILIIAVFGFLIFGPDKLPAMAKTAGKAIAKFKSAQEEMNKVIKTEVFNSESDEPFKNPLDALSNIGKTDKSDEKQESFSERKARYDKERAAKRAAEAQKAQESAAVGTVSVDAMAAAGAGSENDDSVDSLQNKPENSTEASMDASVPQKKPSADELYGTKPVVKKAPATKPGSLTDTKTPTRPTAGKTASTKATAVKTPATKTSTKTVTPKTDAQKAAARSAAAKKAAATRAANKKLVEATNDAVPAATRRKGE